MLTEAAREKQYGQSSPSSGWIAPEYKQSRAVSINRKTAIANHCLLSEENSHALANLEVLRTNLLTHTRARGWRTIMVTSAQPSEGKSVTAINLAVSMSREHQQTVVLVDADLRQPSISDYLGLGPQPGLSDYFTRDIPLQDIILWPGIEKLTLIAGDRPVTNAAELAGSPRMGGLVTELKNRYQDRYVLFDLPPLLAVADPISFIDHVDCVLMVVEAGKTSTKDFRRAYSLIPSEKLLGIVLNKDTTPRLPY